MSAVMMILTNVPITRVPGKGEGVQESHVLTAAAALRAMNVTAAATIANATIASVMILIAMMRPRGAPFPVLRAMRRR